MANHTRMLAGTHERKFDQMPKKYLRVEEYNKIVM